MTSDHGEPSDRDATADSDGARPVATLAPSLRSVARRTDQRRLLVVAGDDADAVDGAAVAALRAAEVSPAGTTLVGDRDVAGLDCERHSPDHARELLGTTREAVVFDGRDRLVPNALGSVVGCVDGGGLLLLLAPALETWPDRTDDFDATLAAPPHDPGDVSGRFRRRFVETLRDRSGVAVFDADEGRVLETGDEDERATPGAVAEDHSPAGDGASGDDDDRGFPAAVLGATRTGDQRRAVAALETVAPTVAAGADGDSAVEPRAAVIEADRGRGKSSAAGLAAGAVAADGGDVTVTAPGRSAAAEVLARARDVTETLDVRAEDGNDGPVRTTTGGVVRFRPPATAADRAATTDLLVVDEAAGIPVERLADTLAADRVVYATTVHGYEGTGRGFAVRFRDRLADADHAVTEVRLATPVRYAAGDPVEAWAFDALLLDARPPVAAVVADATPENVTYQTLDRDALVADRTRLRETVGLLARAHYRTDPDDLARLLDAPNVTVRALTTPPDGDRPGHVVSVALLAREGGLPAERRAAMYEGERIRGHMVPDVLTSQLRDPDAGAPRGLRVLRIATHHAVRSRGLGSRLLAAVEDEFADPDGEDSHRVDYLGVGFGATPRLLRFWARNGYRTVHLSLSRNDRSGEHSAVLLRGLTESGDALAERHGRWFRERMVSAPSGPLADLDPDVVGAALRAAGVEGDDPAPDLSDREWRLVAGAAYGPGLYQIRPAPFRRLAVAALTDPRRPLSDRQERLLVAVVLQGRPVDAVADDLGYHSVGECLRAVGTALATLCDRYGGRVVHEERSRYED